MTKKIIIAGLMVGVVFMLTVKSVMAFQPPYSFGGGERAVHINEVSADPSAIQPTHITTTPQGYEYGSHLGVLTVERLNRTVNVYGGATLESMEKGAGHFSFTGLNHGTVGLVGHNRGNRSGFFSFVHSLNEGDILTLDMNGIIRTYQVATVNIVDETDFSYLQQCGTNRLVLVTCVEGVSSQRRIAVATEI